MAYEFSPMTSLKSLTFNAKLFYVLALGVFIAILMRNSALYPSVFADEYTYSTYSRLLPFSQSPIANYLYLFTFRLTNICGDGFLACARILNTLFFVGAIPFIYQIAKRVSNQNWARWICLLAIIGPINLYTAFFMPEAMYFFIFWVYAWYLLSLTNEIGIKQGMILGGAIGICSLVKPHGIFLLAPTYLYLLYLFSMKEGRNWWRYIQALFAITIAFLVVKFALGYLIAGSAGLSLVGNTYSATTGDFLTAVAASGPESTSRELMGQQPIFYRVQTLFLSLGDLGSNFWNFLRLWMTNLGGHLISLCLLFGYPIWVGAKYLLASKDDKDLKERNKQNAIVFTFIVIFCLILLSSFYSGFLGQASGERSIFRLHERYYNFAFPLLYILVAACASSVQLASLLRVKKSIFLPALFLVITAAIALGLFSQMRPFEPTSIDSPELRGFISKYYIAILLSVVSLLLMVGSLKFFKASARLFLILLAPALLVLSSLVVNKNMWERTQPDLYDRAGLVIKNYLSPSEISKLIVVSDNHIELTRTMFYLNNAMVQPLRLNEKSEFTSKHLPKNYERALLIGDYAISNDIKNQIHFDGFSLIGGHGEILLNFDRAAWPPKSLQGTSGLFSPPEPWGTWTLGSEARLKFVNALPEEFVLAINARAFGKNIDRDVDFCVGSKCYPIRFKDQFSNQSLKIQNPSRENELIIRIPAPTKPISIGIGDDDRLLGLGITSLLITW
jgi:phosphoglycerol transferase